MPLPHPFRAVPPAVALMMLLAGCADQPELASTIDAAARAAPYPDLVPLDPLLTPTEARGNEADKSESELIARRDRLQQRAQRLRSGTVIDRGTQTRMRTGVAPLPAM
ncbi:hypothetical protein [Pontibaca salina]|uniref:DUF3035 domain-containing protein n=1 Tax=Pontibaca salina TaxID=2795731 RepID=A0A934HLG5_9RHOB|nr:hypothetical protein [Pontibaca salina]MBI6629056.1 hypothetical protein [Pontibaca salina]